MDVSEIRKEGGRNRGKGEKREEVLVESESETQVVCLCVFARGKMADGREQEICM